MIPQETIAQETDTTPISQAADQFALLWFSALAQWGPDYGKSGRQQHAWRVQILFDFMSLVEDPFEEDPAWDAFLGDLPAFRSYWSCGCSFQQHTDV